MELVNQHKPQSEVLLYHVTLLKKERKVLILLVLFQFVD